MHLLKSLYFQVRNEDTNAQWWKVIYSEFQKHEVTEWEWKHISWLWCKGFEKTMELCPQRQKTHWTTSLPHRWADVPLVCYPVAALERGLIRRSREWWRRGWPISCHSGVSLPPDAPAQEDNQGIPLLSSYWGQVPQRLSQALYQIILTTATWAWDYYHPHFTDEKPEAQRWSGWLRVTHQQEAEQDERPGWHGAQGLPTTQNCFWGVGCWGRILCWELHRKEAKTMTVRWYIS